MALKEQLLSTILKREELSPLERYKFESLLNDKFGRDGLRVYFLINGANSVQQILSQTGVGEKKLLEFLNFASDSGIIRISPTLLEELPASAPSVSPEMARAKSGIMPTLRSSAEKKLYDRFGQQGVEVYRLMDEVSLPSEILSRIQIEESRLLEILKFMQGEGLISLSAPKEEPAAVEEEEIPAPEPQKPVREQPPPKKEPPKPSQELALPPRPIYLPIKKQLGLFGRLKIEAELIKRFGQQGMHFFSLIDGEKTTIKLAKASRYPMELIDRILDLLSSNGAIELRELTGDEIRERYGEEGLAIYDVYGRDGVLIYEMIDKRATIKDIIMASGIPPKRGVEIFAFIHKILGLEIPLDTSILYRQLGIEE